MVRNRAGDERGTQRTLKTSPLPTTPCWTQLRVTAISTANEMATAVQPGDKRPYELFPVLQGQGIPICWSETCKDFKTLTEGFSCLVAKSCLTPVSPRTVARQAPLSMGLSRQEYWVGCHFLLQGILPAQGSNLRLLHCRWILYHWAT